MKILLKKPSGQPFIVIKETSKGAYIAPLTNFHFKDKDVTIVSTQRVKEDYNERDLKCFGLLRNSIMTTDENGEILNNRVSYKVEVRS